MLFSSCKTPFRVWFTDLDVLFHMNNGKYFSLMDLARTDLMVRSGAFRKLSKEKMYPVVAAETMKFKRSLNLFQKFIIETKVIGWDEKSVFLEQIFKSKKGIHAYAVVRGQFLKKGGERVFTQELMDILKSEKILKVPLDLEQWDKNLEKRFESINC